MVDRDLWVVIDKAGEVLKVYNDQQRALDYAASAKEETGRGVVLVGVRHPQYEQLARHEIGLLLYGYGRGDGTAHRQSH